MSRGKSKTELSKSKIKEIVIDEDVYWICKTEKKDQQVNYYLVIKDGNYIKTPVRKDASRVLERLHKLLNDRVVIKSEKTMEMS